MGTVSGTFKAHPDAALIWVDAHAVSSAVGGADASCDKRESAEPDHNYL